MNLIDIHNHTLFGVDDGAKTLDEALLMIDEAIKNNISHIVLTPHYNKRSHSVNTVLKHFDELKNAVKDRPIELYLGREHKYYELEKNPVYYTMHDSKHVLIEFDTVLENPIEEICYSLSLKGYKPIVAHIERYHYLTKEDYMLIKQYAELQINSNSVLGLSSVKKDNKIAKYLLKNKLADYVASDTHDVTRRNNTLFQAYKRVKKKYGVQYANTLFKENAKKIIEDQTII